MEKLQCEVVQDLLVLYEDNVCSEQSREMIETHIETCDICRGIYGRMKQEIPVVEVPKEVEEGKRFIKGVKKNIFIRKMLAMLIPLLLAVVIIIFGFEARTADLTEDDILGIYMLENGDVICQVNSPSAYANLTFYEPGEWNRYMGDAYFTYSYTLFEKYRYSGTYANQPWTIIFNVSAWGEDTTRIMYGEEEDSKGWTVWQKGQELEPASAELEETAAAMRLLNINCGSDIDIR